MTRSTAGRSWPCPRLRPSEGSRCRTCSCGGWAARSRTAPDATAFAHRHGASLITIVGGWTEAADRAGETAWAQRTWTATRRLARGTDVNHLENEGEQRVREAYPAGTWHRLTTLKARLDPGNLFRHNPNVPPAAS